MTDYTAPLTDIRFLLNELAGLPDIGAQVCFVGQVRDFGDSQAVTALEQQVLYNVIVAYTGLVEAQEVLKLNQNNVDVLTVNVQATRDRFDIGDLTRTDVAQSEAQLASGRTSLLSAESTLNTTRANYRRIIGVEPTARLTPGRPEIGRAHV